MNKKMTWMDSWMIAMSESKKTNLYDEITRIGDWARGWYLDISANANKALKANIISKEYHKDFTKKLVERHAWIQQGLGKLQKNHWKLFHDQHLARCKEFNLK